MYQRCLYKRIAEQYARLLCRFVCREKACGNKNARPVREHPEGFPKTGRTSAFARQTV
ncbi:MAG: hypothetical protein HFF86_05320 [Oscillibacter sp.]|nr:hypothetical protein [Oscillibacter sp.]